jgi:hypothetical protein
MLAEQWAERLRKIVMYSAAARDFSFLEKFQTGSCNQTPSLAMDIGGTFARG